MNNARETLVATITELKAKCEALLQTPESDVRKISTVCDIKDMCNSMLTDLSDELFSKEPAWNGFSSIDALSMNVSTNSQRLDWLEGAGYADKLLKLVAAL